MFLDIWRAKRPKNAQHFEVLPFSVLPYRTADKNAQHFEVLPFSVLPYRTADKNAQHFEVLPFSVLPYRTAKKCVTSGGYHDTTKI